MELAIFVFQKTGQYQLELQFEFSVMLGRKQLFISGEKSISAFLDTITVYTQ